MCKNLYFIIFSFCCNFIFGQYTNLKFENLNTNEGLSSSTCLEVFQDSQGFLWFGTIDGLNKYNGYEFEVMRPIFNDSTSISNNRINVIQEDKQTHLWIGTNNGLNFYNRNTKKFKRISLYDQPLKFNNPKQIINTLLYDEEENQFWVGTTNGIIKLSLEEDTTDVENITTTHYSHLTNNMNSIDDDNVNAIKKDKDGIIWVGTNGSPKEDPSRISAHDMIVGKYSPAWHQNGAITAVQAGGGKWKIEFVEDAEYKISLRRFPRESGLAINATFPAQKEAIEYDKTWPAGIKTDFKEAFLYVANISKTLEIKEGQDEVVFKGKIPAGKYDMEAQLIDELGRLYPAYYVYIEKVKSL